MPGLQPFQEFTGDSCVECKADRHIPVACQKFFCQSRQLVYSQHPEKTQPYGSGPQGALMQHFHSGIQSL